VTMDGVENVALSGFTFTDTSGSGEYDSSDAAVYVTNGSSNITISDSNFEDVAAGVKVDFGANQVRVENSNFVDTWGHAIEFGDGSSVNVAANNSILRPGAEYEEASGIELNESFGNTVTRNIIKDSPRHAIEEQNWDPTNPSGGNLIEYNEIENYMLETEDGGGIYLFGGDDPFTPFASTIQYNRIEGEADDFSWGIYLDDLVNGGNIIGNYVNGGGVASLMIHGGDRNEVANNVFLNGEQYGITVQTGLVNPDDPILLDNIHHNIIAPDEGIFGASDARGIQFHDNIYVGGPDNQYFGWDGETFEEWQESGGDRGSIVLDSLPGFIPGGGTDPDNNPDFPGDFPGFNPDLPNFNPDWDPIFGERNLNPDFDPNFDPDIDVSEDDDEEGFSIGDEEEEDFASEEDDGNIQLSTANLQLTDEPDFLPVNISEILQLQPDWELDIMEEMTGPMNGEMEEELSPAYAGVTEDVNVRNLFPVQD